MERYFMFMDQKSQNYKDVSFPNQLNLWIKGNKLKATRIPVNYL